MPARHLKPLYKGKCLEDLKVFFEISKIEADPKRLCKSAPKLFKAAEENRLIGDEEVSYILYMKFLSVVARLKEYKTTAKKEVDSGEIKKQHVSEALDYAEKLSASLSNRYEELQQKELEVANKLKVISIEEEDEEEVVKRELSKSLVKPHPPEIINGYADVSDEFISCTRLYNLLKENKLLLIMDVRSVSSFKDSHLKADCVINVPDSVVKAGMTAVRLENALPANSKDLWAQRGAMDLIVLIDWNTSVKNHNPETVVSFLKDILLKWDLDIQYNNHPLILDGGYEEWLLRYPVCTTNPSPSYIPSVENLELTDFLGEIEYPNLSESSESLQPTVDRSSKPVPSPSVFPKCAPPKSPNVVPSKTIISIPSKPVVTNKRTLSEPVDFRPSVDRKSKAAALLMYQHSQDVQAILHQEEKVAAATLELEENMQRKEEERERIRMQREMEAEEEMKLQLQEREEQLLRDIQHLEQLQQEKDKENQALRDELAEYKNREREETLPQEYSIYKEEEEAIAARIRNSVDRRNKIVKDREKRHYDENQKKKPVPNDTPNRFTYEEREKQARAMLLQERERQKQAKLEEGSKERIVQDANDSKGYRSPGPSRCSTPPDKHREQKKPSDTQSEQSSSFKNKTNAGTYIAPLKETPSGIMKRSRSSPNIAQLNDDDLISKGKPYKSNFTVDVRSSRQRNFSPVYGGLGRGLTGLKNLGNTCYMNSIIQCLSNTTPLTKYFVGGDYHGDINRHNETRGEIAEEVAAVVRALWNNNLKCIAARDLRSVVGKHRDQFQSNQQQDSNEFLTILMDWLHEDLKKPSVNSMGDVRREQSDWEKQWDEFYKENSSLIVLLFYGQQKSTVQCLKCRKESVRYETFSNLTLPLPSNNNCTLEECVQLYVKGERITGWKCPVCKEQRDATKKFDIIKLPPILIIHFKRFYIDGWCRKRQTFVNFPLVDWDMKNYTLLPEQKYTKYNLYGVSNHYGTMEGGHYTAYCKNVEYKKWFKFDDNEVSEISPGDVKSGAAYILFYASINFRVPDVS